jgi:formyl-CoA transferase
MGTTLGWGPAELVPQLQALFRNCDTAEWIHLLLRENIPVGLVNDIPTVLNDPQVQARQMVQEVEHLSAGTIKLVSPVAKLSATPAEILTAPPPLGSDTEEILNRCLDISPCDVEKLREAGVF